MGENGRAAPENHGEALSAPILSVCGKPVRRLSRRNACPYCELNWCTVFWMQSVRGQQLPLAVTARSRSACHNNGDGWRLWQRGHTPPPPSRATSHRYRCVYVQCRLNLVDNRLFTARLGDLYRRNRMTNESVPPVRGKPSSNGCAPSSRQIIIVNNITICMKQRV